MFCVFYIKIELISDISRTIRTCALGMNIARMYKLILKQFNIYWSKTIKDSDTVITFNVIYLGDMTFKFTQEHPKITYQRHDAFNNN